MLRVRKGILALALCGIIAAGIASGEDPSHGATNFVIVPVGRLWHPIGPAKQITGWSGPFVNAGGHPANVYILYTKQPAGTPPSVRPLPSDLHVYHMLSTDFYYPVKAGEPCAPATRGYTADGFVVADSLSSAL